MRHLVAGLIECDAPVCPVMREPERGGPGVQGAQPISQSIRYSTWMSAHMTNAGKPTTLNLPECATARMRPIVAMLPSKYLKGAALASPSRRSYHVPDVLSLLNRGLRDTRKSIERHRVTDREHLRMAGRSAVGLHPRFAPPGPSQRP